MLFRLEKFVILVIHCYAKIILFRCGAAKSLRRRNAENSKRGKGGHHLQRTKLFNKTITANFIVLVLVNRYLFDYLFKQK